MILHLYQLICLFIAALTVAVVFREPAIGRQLTGGLVLVMLLLRVFLIK